MKRYQSRKHDIDGEEFGVILTCLALLMLFLALMV